MSVFGSYPSAQWAQDFTSQSKDPCQDFWAQDFTLKIEVKMRAFEVKIRAYEVKSSAYEVKIRAYEVKISAYEVMSCAQKSWHASLPHEVKIRAWIFGPKTSTHRH